MSPAPAPAKICVVCGQDCSTRPRTKDPHGRYACNECLEKARSARSHVAAVAPEPPVEAPQPLVEDDGPLAIVEDESPPVRASMPCPHCSRPLPPDAVICVGCGFNRATGHKVGSVDGKAAGSGKGRVVFTCSQCGYDLTGLKTTRCPECGKVNTLRSSKRERELEESRRVVRLAYIKPAIMLVAGLAVMLAITAGQGGSMAAAWDVLRFGVGFAISLLVYFVCSVIFIGFDEPFHLTTLRLAGVYAVTEAIGTVISPVLPGISGGILLGAVWIGLMVTVMEIEKEDAIIFGVVSFIVKVVAALWLLSLL